MAHNIVLNASRKHNIRPLLIGLATLTAALIGALAYVDRPLHYTPKAPSQTMWRRTKPAVWPACMPVDIRHAGKPLRVMCFGDSITFGNGNQTIAMGGYREALRRLIVRPIVFVGQQKCGYPEIAANEGYPSWGAGDLAPIAKQCAATDRPDVVLFMAGVNDLNPYHHESMVTVVQYEMACIRNIAAGAPSAIILVANLTPVGPGPYIPIDREADLSAQFPGIVRKLQMEGVNCRLVDMAHEVHLLPSEYDVMKVHPLDSGCVKEARVWAAAIKDYVR